MRVGSWRTPLLVAWGGLAAVAMGWWQVRGLVDPPGLRVHAHNGRWVLKPSLILPSSPGQPPDFESHGNSLIEIPDRLATKGREVLVAGPGCGLLRGELAGEDRIDLPPPIEVTIRVPGDFTLPSGDHGIMLRFHAADVRPEIASVVEGAAAPSSHWDKPESPVWDEQIWLDPASRSVSVLLPCTGAWRVEWTHTTRPGPGEFQSLGIVFGMGESVVNVASDGEEIAVAIDPDALDVHGFGLGGD